MPLVNERVGAFSVSVLLLAIPWLYFTFPLSRIKKFQTSSTGTSGSAPVRNDRVTDRTWLWLSLSIAFHSFYALYDLIIRAPFNIFTELDVSIADPTDVLRALLLHTSATPNLSPDLNALLNRLHSFDMREKYILFGDYPLRHCTYCDRTLDFALFGLPRVMRAYIRAAIVIGLLTLPRSAGSRAARLRFWALIALMGAAVTEMYVLVTADVAFPPAHTAMIHDNLHVARHTFLLFLPPIVYTLARIRLPWSRRTPPLATMDLTALPHLQLQAQQFVSRLRVLRLTSAARARSPRLSEASMQWWCAMREEGKRAREDARVQDMAERLGVGFVDGGADADVNVNVDLNVDEQGTGAEERGASAHGGRAKEKGMLKRQAHAAVKGVLEAFGRIQDSKLS